MTGDWWASLIVLTLLLKSITDHGHRVPQLQHVHEAVCVPNRAGFSRLLAPFVLVLLSLLSHRGAGKGSNVAKASHGVLAWGLNTLQQLKTNLVLLIWSRDIKDLQLYWWWDCSTPNSLKNWTSLNFRPLGIALCCYKEKHSCNFCPMFLWCCIMLIGFYNTVIKSLAGFPL